MSFQHSKEVVTIYENLAEIDVCLRCILRYLGANVPTETDFYKNPKQFFETHGVIFSDGDSENVAKKTKKNPCPVCLDCFTESKIEKIAECLKTSNINEYNYKDFFLNISWPKCLIIRTYSLYLHLKERFPEMDFCKYFDDEGPCLANPGRIFRCLASDIFALKINKTYHPKSHLSILINLGYENDEKEIENLKIFDKLSKQPKKSRKSKKDTPTDALKWGRNIIPGIVRNITPKQFKDNFKVPPVTPEKEVFVENITITADSMYLGGRYLKFSRSLCQTPWVIDGKNVTEYNLQDIIFDGVCNVLRIDPKNLTFCASGREDVDVRMLGTGRPFYIKIDDPKNRHVSSEDCRKIESEILKLKLAAVTNLQPIFASDVQQIKQGEESKTKWYKAVCHTECSSLDEVFEKVREVFMNPVEIVQTTPIRVLHRRTLMERKRCISKLNITKIEGMPNLFEIDIQTQAGTYVKEFVNGDFNRTVPSLASVIGHPTDLVALDCMCIELEWPVS